MNLVSILLTGFALSMDAFAVSVTKGMSLRKSSKKISIKIAAFFGLFQGGMPLLGWFLGLSFQNYIKSIDHWIALILLSILGFKMIYEFLENPCTKCNENSSLTSKTNLTLNNQSSIDNISNKELTSLAIATSIDALAIGVSFAFLNVNIISSSIIIAIVTFIICLIGVSTGKKIGCLFKNYAELVGGLLLIFIGISIFNEHTGFISNLLSNIF